MLRSIKEIIGYTLMATDGEIGECGDFLFEDRPWIIRHIVVNTGNWLIGRKVLVSMAALEKPDWVTKRFHVNLTKQQVEKSSPLQEDEPVSMRYERLSFEFYNWPMYWEIETNENRIGKSSLRSSNEVFGYNVQNDEAVIGNIYDFIVEDDIWAIRYIAVEMKEDLGRKKVLLSPEWIHSVNWLSQSAHIDFTGEQVLNCPDYDPSTPINRKYESIIYDYYGRPHYW